MDTQKKHSLSGSIVLASCFILLAGACDSIDRIEMEAQTENVLLNFNASTIDATTTETRSVEHIEGFTENSYDFGMSVTKDNASRGEIFEGSGDLTATMSRVSEGREWNWLFRKNVDNTPVTPRGPEGKPLRVIAYYPAIIGTEAFTNGIPFDFTQTSNLRQTEILYNTNTSYTITPSAADKVTIPLKFQHAYSWIIINVTKYVDKGTYDLTSVAIDNLSGGWIKNKGNINPETGLAMKGATEGPIGEVRAARALSTGTPVTYEFLVPAFMDNGVKDEDVVITLMINGHKEIFPLERTHLNKDGDKYGFSQGYINTYNLEFNNSSLNMRLLNWRSTNISGNFGESTATPTNFQKINYNDSRFSWTSATGGIKFPPLYKPLPANDHRFESYLTTVNYGSNGEYVSASPVTASPPPGGIIIEDDANVATQEPVCKVFQMTTADISIEPVQWEDENGQLVAKEICSKYNGGGFKDWRLPRAFELRALFVYLIYNIGYDEFRNLNFNEFNGNLNKLYWTGTEESEDKAWAMLYYNEGDLTHRGPKISPQDKRTKLSVRCIRDVK